MEYEKRSSNKRLVAYLPRRCHNTGFVKPDLIIITFFLFLFANGIAQEAILSAGENISNDNGSISYSVGQTSYTWITGNTGLVAQGVQQPYEIMEITAIDANKTGLSVLVYPNPVSDILVLKVESETQNPYVATLYDIQGKMLESKNITDQETYFTLTDMKTACYFLRVIKDNKEVKVFKIIKK